MKPYEGVRTMKTQVKVHLRECVYYGNKLEMSNLFIGLSQPVGIGLYKE